MRSSKHVLEGRCWKFGDNIMNDGGLMHHDFVKKQVWDKDVLKHHCLENVNPDFAKSAKPGDIIVAGKKFAHGNFHIQGFLGLKGLGVGVVVSDGVVDQSRGDVVAGEVTQRREPDGWCRRVYEERGVGL